MHTKNVTCRRKAQGEKYAHVHQSSSVVSPCTRRNCRSSEILTNLTKVCHSEHVNRQAAAGPPLPTLPPLPQAPPQTHMHMQYTPVINQRVAVADGGGRFCKGHEQTTDAGLHHCEGQPYTHEPKPVEGHDITHTHTTDTTAHVRLVAQSACTHTANSCL